MARYKSVDPDLSTLLPFGSRSRFFQGHSSTR